MAINSNIEWTHHTANLWWGCTKVHEGCDNCYAETLANRFGNDIWGNGKPRKEIKRVWTELKKMQEAAAKAGEIHRVFVGSMMDIFEKPMPVIDSNGNLITDCHCDICDGEFTTEHLRQWLFDSVIPSSPNLMFLLLTKRPSNINKYIPESWITNPPENVAFGTSPVNQQTFDLLVKQLQQVNGKRFLSIEPQLSEIDLGALQGIDWIIQGGESGPNKRPFDIAWAYKMKQQCAELGIPYFFKQIDKVKKPPQDLLTAKAFPIWRTTTT